MPYYGPLSAAASMLQASGPSRMPVGLGQVVGQGLAGFLQGSRLDESEKRRKNLQTSLGKISSALSPPEVKSLWQASAQEPAQIAGLPMRYFSSLAHSESGNRNIPQGVNATGSAFGPFQFTEGTWKDVISQHPELGLTASDRFMPAAQGRAVVPFTRDNSQALQAAFGRPPTQGELGLAHRFGVQGAINLLRSKRNQSVASVLPQATAANPQWARMTVDDVIRNTEEAVSQEEEEPGGRVQVASAGGMQGLLGGGLAATPITSGRGLADLFGGGGDIAPQPYGSGLQNMTPEMRGILQTALTSGDPDLGMAAVSALFQVAGGSQQQKGARSQMTDKVMNAIAAGLTPGTKEWRDAIVGDQTKEAKDVRTSAQKDAEALGLRPGTPEYDKYIRERTLPQAAAAPQVTVAPQINVGGPQPVNKSLDTQFQAAIDSGKAARTKLAELSAVETALSGLPTGRGAETIANVGSLLRGVGLNPEQLGLPDTASRAQVAEALIKPLVLDLRNPSGGAGMPGALSDNDLKFLTKSTVSISNTPGANAGIIMLQRRVQQRSLDIERIALEHMERNQGNVTPSFLREIRTYADKNQLFDDEFKKQYESVISAPTPSVVGKQPAAPASAAPAAPGATTAPTAAAINTASQAQLRQWMSDPAIGDAILKDPALKSALDQRLGRR